MKQCSSLYSSIIVQYSAVQCSKTVVPYGIEQFNTVQYAIIPYRIVQYDTVEYSSTAVHYTLV